MPNHPNYFLGAEAGSICDSLTNSIENIIPSGKSISIYPNPAKDFLSVLNIDGETVSVEILNELGQVINQQKDFQISNSILNIKIGYIANGIYFIKLKTNQSTTIHKFIKQ